MKIDIAYFIPHNSKLYVFCFFFFVNLDSDVSILLIFKIIRCFFFCLIDFYLYYYLLPSDSFEFILLLSSWVGP